MQCIGLDIEALCIKDECRCNENFKEDLNPENGNKCIRVDSCDNYNPCFEGQTCIENICKGPGFENTTEMITEAAEAAKPEISLLGIAGIVGGVLAVILVTFCFVFCVYCTKEDRRDSRY